MFTNASHFVISGGQFINTCELITVSLSNFLIFLVAGDEQKKIMDWLKAPNCSTNYTAAVNKRVKNTGKWILDHPVYKEWKQTGDILWIQGKGKFSDIFNGKI